MTNRHRLRIAVVQLIVVAGLGFAAALLTPAARADVPELAKIKAAAEGGDPAAQFKFSQSLGAGSTEGRRWLDMAAAQNYGPAEDEIAWTAGYVYFASATPDTKTRDYYVRTYGAKMMQSLVFACRAADKGFSRSRVILALAYAHGCLLQNEDVEAYKWVVLSNGGDLMATMVAGTLKNELLKRMPIAQVQAGESLAASFRPGDTAARIRFALFMPQLKLNGIASANGQPVAVLNGVRLTEGHDFQVTVCGVSVTVRCVAVLAKEAILMLPPDTRKIVLRPGAAPTVLE